MPEDDPGKLLHNCEETLDQVCSERPDLTEAEAILFTDGTSQVIDGTRRSRAAVTTETEVIWAQALPAGTSAQTVEMPTGNCPAQDLRWAEGKKANIYTDSRYAYFTCAQSHLQGAGVTNR